MSGYVVVDASLAVKWLVNEVHSEQAFALAQSWIRAELQPVAPYLMPVEVANALHRRALRGDVSAEAAERLLGGLLASGIQLMEPLGLHERALALARRLRQEAVYDAHYLALAETLACEMWTADQRLFRAAGSSFTWLKWLGAFEEEAQSL